MVLQTHAEREPLTPVVPSREGNDDRHIIRGPAEVDRIEERCPGSRSPSGTIVIHCLELRGPPRNALGQAKTGEWWRWLSAPKRDISPLFISAVKGSVISATPDRGSLN